MANVNAPGAKFGYPFGQLLGTVLVGLKENEYVEFIGKIIYNARHDAER